MLNKTIICCKQGHDVNYQEAQVGGINLMNRRKRRDASNEMQIRGGC
jgi:hypothetical protein